MTYRLKPESKDQPTPSPAKSRPGKSTGNSDSLGRLTSLDAFRGFIMIMLAASGFGIYGLSKTDEASDLWKIVNHETFERIAFHFEHPPWQSNFVIGSTDAEEGSVWLKWKVSFWDLIQPSFMFMVGLAMPFSYARREKTGQSGFKRMLHALIRACILVLLGVFLYSRRTESTNWIFTNVLAQIGLGYFFVYLLVGVPRWTQITAFVVILVGTTVGMQFTPETSEFIPDQVNASYAEGDVFAEPYVRWSKNGNAFHDFDTWFLNQFPRPENKNGEVNRHEFNAGGYTTLNFVPSMATILLGLFVGQFVLVAPRSSKTLGILVLAAVLCTALGVLAGATCCPIVKRIWTPAWVLFSGGYVIGIFAMMYLLFDLLPFKKLAFPLVVVGMNSIAVYMMGQMLRPWIYKEVVTTHFSWLIDKCLGWVQDLSGVAYSVEEMRVALEPVIMPTSVFVVIWLTCYWMYRQRIFIRI